jgi:hypothetical protein
MTPLAMVIGRKEMLLYVALAVSLFVKQILREKHELKILEAK